MRNDIKLEKWSIGTKPAARDDDFFESVFFSGNGRMGARGYLACADDAPPFRNGLFVAGMFGELKPGLTDFMNLPTPVYAKIWADGTKAATGGAAVSRALDLRGGLFTAEFTARCAGKSLRVKEERFFSLADTGLLVQRITLTPEEDMDLELFGGVRTSCCNLPVPDDQTKDNTRTEQLAEIVRKDFSDGGLCVELTAKGTRLRVREEVAFRAGALAFRRVSEDEEGAGLVFGGRVSAGQTASVEQCAFVATSRDRDPRIRRPAPDWSFDALFAQNRAAWAERWETADIEIEGDGETDAAVRYQIFELIANDSAGDPSVSIGARGLTHTRYKGCYFWDCDLFMMPFYLYTDPGAAKNLMRYRADALPQAKRHAQGMNCPGARYPWMASFDGSEQCESWDIGASELHVTADIVFAMDQYVQATGDLDFYAHGAAEVYVETARFWAGRYTPEPGTGRVNLLFCKGPDEYCGITGNNLYTNMLVKRNLRLARGAARYLLENDEAAARRLALTEEEAAAWAALEDAIKLPRDPATGRWKQDDTFDLLEPVRVSDLKRNDAASYRTVCFDRLQRYRVIKQADVILLMTRLPEVFTAAEKLAAWQDFEPVCLHDSTLSFATHALFAAQNGLTDAARSYFRRALFLDLRDVMENTGMEGLHAACLGECWQTVVFGFGGLSFENGKPKLTPRLPQNIRGLRFRFFYRGEAYEASVGSGRASLHKLGSGAGPERQTETKRGSAL